MALAPINPTQLTPPRVAFIDERSGAISREWYRFFLSLLTATQTNQDEINLAPDTTSLLATYDAMLAELAQATEVQPDGASASDVAVVQSDIQALELAPPSHSGVVPTMEGGTGQTSYADGQLLIGSTVANTLVKALLTAGANITITNAAGAITIAVSGLGTMAFKNIGASGSFTAGANTVTVVDGIITSIV
jgi:hypothetical protein